MTRDLRRAVAYLLVGSLVFLAPALDAHYGSSTAAAATAAVFGLVAVAGFKTSDGPLFELFARRRDRAEERLYGLASFALAVAALGVLLVAVELPAVVPVVAVFVLTVGNVGQRLAAGYVASPAVGASAFAAFGTVGGSVAAVAAGWLGAAVASLPLVVFVAASGALLGGLIRSVLYVQDDSLVVLAVALLVWLLLSLGLSPTPERVAVGLAVTVGLGYIAYALDTASVTGMLTGVLLALFAVVLGGYGWFVLLVTFFGLGGLASKYRYDEKLDRGIAQENEGARGGGNVLANSAVALVAVVGYAASGHVGIDATVFKFAFAGAVAAALADTFSSEFGGLFDAPRLITTLERVDPGTDGGVTWQGAVAGATGSGIIAGLGWAFFEFDTIATATVLGAGVLGMVVDSILGATLEGGRLGNQSVNLLATLSAGTAAAVVAVLI
ncbi:DUF92 family protein [Natronomonas pharaonis DSM 2160]|uniref:DUF92 family protein n=1 Tax=Natronomonas pharaonis (strain ATCC 35678 / DSM 2160 / CIP 103997 / JCM 8858 / NBRC 14720 / NCIMB 2260 / Gabara) TaxID=348780 RepID=A0A1U7EYM3_NATPD|nr:DUF92 domain-containing protein [Natronomonas pharaonis]CAI50362.1 DUF92 family protein [Natronomonas pharaonis DSM 2160]